jgi:hypothetical protein
LTTALLVGAFVPPALAQDPDVIVDPGSPSGKEYAIPLEQARDDALGSGATDRKRRAGKETGADRAPLFGVGIDASAKAEPTKARTKKAASRRAREREREDSDEPPGTAAVDAPPPDLRELVAPPDGGTGDLAPIGAGVGAVLLLGGLLGVALRRRPGPAG